MGGAGLGAGAALGSSVGQIAMTPFNAANNFLGSYFFGYGMILGERQMYQSDWPKIQKELEEGKPFIEILERYTRTNTAAVMQQAKNNIWNCSRRNARNIQRYNTRSNRNRWR